MKLAKRPGKPSQLTETAKPAPAPNPVKPAPVATKTKVAPLPVQQPVISEADQILTEFVHEQENSAAQNVSITEIAKQYLTKLAIFEAGAAAVKQIGDAVNVLEETLKSTMAAQSVKTLKLDNGVALTLRESVFPGIQNKAFVYAWLKENAPDLVYETINDGKFRKWFRETNEQRNAEGESTVDEQLIAEFWLQQEGHPADAFDIYFEEERIRKTKNKQSIVAEIGPEIISTFKKTTLSVTGLRVQKTQESES